MCTVMDFVLLMIFPFLFLTCAWSVWLPRSARPIGSDRLWLFLTSALPSIINQMLWTSNTAQWKSLQSVTRDQVIINGNPCNAMTDDGLFQFGIFRFGLFQFRIFRSLLFHFGLFQFGLFRSGLFWTFPDRHFPVWTFPVYKSSFPDISSLEFSLLKKKEKKLFIPVNDMLSAPIVGIKSSRKYFGSYFWGIKTHNSTFSMHASFLYIRDHLRKSHQAGHQMSINWMVN